MSKIHTFPFAARGTRLERLPSGGRFRVGDAVQLPAVSTSTCSSYSAGSETTAQSSGYLQSSIAS